VWLALQRELEITIMIVANSRVLAGPEAQDGTR
jgi:hypothetical protein